VAGEVCFWSILPTPVGKTMDYCLERPEYTLNGWLSD
jgi:hypothetical protein